MTQLSMMTAATVIESPLGGPITPPSGMPGRVAARVRRIALQHGTPRTYQRIYRLGKVFGAGLAGAVLWKWLGPDRPEGEVVSSLDRFEHLALPLLVAVVVMVAAAYHELRWARPLRKLRALAAEARSGRAPIETLAPLASFSNSGAVIDEVRETAGLVQELLRDVREQKRIVAELHQQIRQRVAQRTDALERALGVLRKQAARDALTGLYNRRVLDEMLPRQLLDTATHPGQELSALMIDVDHFKQLNDTLGHDAGDRLLRDIGQVIGSGLRKQDAAFRVGGDEFVVLMPGANAEAAQIVGNRLVALIDALAKTVDVQPRPRLSFGAATVTGSATTSESLLRAADKELYAMKASRRAISRAA